MVIASPGGANLFAQNVPGITGFLDCVLSRNAFKLLIVYELRFVSNEELPALCSTAREGDDS